MRLTLTLNESEFSVHARLINLYFQIQAIVIFRNYGLLSSASQRIISWVNNFIFIIWGMLKTYKCVLF